LVKKNQLSVLKDRPLGVRAVTNIVEASGAKDKENLEDARKNAPLGVTTIGRLISVRDFEDFAASFAGVSKASAIWHWDGEKKVVRITLAGEQGKPFMTDYLHEAINRIKDPLINFELVLYEPIYINISADVIVHRDWDLDTVKEEIVENLERKYAFDAADFGKNIMESQVLVAIQSIKGVSFADASISRSDGVPTNVSIEGNQLMVTDRSRMTILARYEV
jgi:hypothetical protein